MPRPRKEDSTELERVAREYYLNGLSQRQIASLPGYEVNQSTIAHRLRRARETGVVSIDVDRSFALTGTVNLALSRQLRDMFRFENCLVVGIGNASELEDEKDDDLHTALSNATGAFVRDWIQPGDHVAIAGGRAAVAIARFVKRNPPLRSNIRITPLSGRIWTGSWQVDGDDHLERPLDADDAARLLALAFEHERGTRYSQIGLPLYAENPQQARKLVNDNCACRTDGTWNWNLQRPNRALVGVGVLHPESAHRISEFLLRKPQPSASGPYLNRATSTLRGAMQLVSGSSMPYFGDVANRLYPVLPLPGVIEQGLPDPDRYIKLRDELTKLNKKALVAKWQHLKDIPSVLATAGGALKVEAIWTLSLARLIDCESTSKGSNSVVTELSTDEETAKTLVNSMLRFQAAKPEIRQWYAGLVPRLFED